MRSMMKSMLLGGVVLVLLFAAALPSRVQAISVLRVNPNLVVSGETTTIAVVGADFVDGAVVSVGKSQLTTTFVNASRLSAIFPQDIRPGVYDVTVVNPDSSSAVLSAGLTVVKPTPTPRPTATEAPFQRPLMAVTAYDMDSGKVKYGKSFELEVAIKNKGQLWATNIQVTFTSTDLTPLDNGGVVVIGTLPAGETKVIKQHLKASALIVDKNTVSLDMTASYYDAQGTQYSDKFTLSLPAEGSSSGGSGGPYYTATPTGMHRSQLVITSYNTDVELLQPGLQFTLQMVVQNMGNIAAKGVTMIAGGGSTSSGDDGTPSPGGVSGGSGEFTNFAPVGSSNVQSLGEFAPGAVRNASQKLIVNVSTNPGAYPMKITFSYLDDKGNQVNDEQVVTLLVYNLPNLDVSFYQPVETLLTGQPNMLPLQVVNLGKRSIVLGMLKVKAVSGTVENGEALVGSLDTGGYFTTDAMLTPDVPGSLELTVEINYLDDFNQARTVTKTLTVEVEEAAPMPGPEEGGPEGMGNSAESETFLHKVWRFFLGLLGLDSSASAGPEPAPTEAPMPKGLG